MATINLNLSKKENVETSACELLIRLSLKRGVVYRVKSGIYVPAKSWNVAKSKVIIPRMHTRERAQLAKIQSVIDELTNLLIERCVDTPIETIDKKWVEQIIHVFHFGEDSNKEEGEETLVEAFDQFIKERAKKDDRKRQFLCLKRMLLRYELYCGKHYVLELGSLTVDRLCKFEDFLRIEHTFFNRQKKCDNKYMYLYEAVPETRKPQKRGENAIHSIMKRLRTFYNWCEKTGRTKNNPFKKYSLRECVYGTPFFLTIEEIKQLYDFDFSSDSQLAIQRDIFIFQCSIGMRIGDFYRLTKGNIVGDAIEYIPSKTVDESGKVARVPLIMRAKEILNRYKDFAGIALFPFIAEQNYNKAIKEMLKLAGINRVVTTLNPTIRKEEKHPIWEVASSHIARRSFIGNLYAKVKDPDLIGTMTGHIEGSKAFARYRVIDDCIKRDVLTGLE